MKHIVSCLLGIALLACGGKSKDPNASMSSSDPGSAAPATGDGQPCAQEIAMVCPDGQVDACLETPPEGDTHRCVANESAGAQSKCATDGGRCQAKVAMTACKRFEEGAEWGCTAPDSGCCLN